MQDIYTEGGGTTNAAGNLCIHSLSSQACTQSLWSNMHNDYLWPIDPLATYIISHLILIQRFLIAFGRWRKKSPSYVASTFLDDDARVDSWSNSTNNTRYIQEKTTGKAIQKRRKSETAFGLEVRFCFLAAFGHKGPWLAFVPKANRYELSFRAECAEKHKQKVKTLW
jgi:hypothetical protein